MANVLYVPSANFMGRRCLAEYGSFIKELGLKKALIVIEEKILCEDNPSV